MTAVSDTSPLRYLIAIGRADLMRDIFGRVLIPRGVEQELTDPAAPETVRQWIEQRPPWLEIRDLPQPPDPELTRRLDRGEAEAIRLAMDLRADFLLMDERRGRQMATAR
jgi:predicted nucleic acid-binding protein